VRRVLVLTTLTLCSAVALLAQSHSKYRNRALGYCVAYPSDWSVIEPFDGRAAEFIPPGIKGSIAGSIPIEVSGAANQPNEKDDTRQNSLEDNVRITIEGMKQEFGELDNVSTEASSLDSLRGIKLSLRYPDKITHHLKVWTGILALSSDRRILYAVSLTEPLGDTAYESVFREIVQSFQLSCTAHQRHRNRTN
jgi:hypothetical protein